MKAGDRQIPAGDGAASQSALLPLPLAGGEDRGAGAARRFDLSELIGVLARWALGGIFIYMGLSKAILNDPSAFLTLVREYNVVTSPFLLNYIAAILPWFEVFCGLLLVTGSAVRGAALMLVLMLVPFTLLVLQRALALAATSGLSFCEIKFDCGCGNGEVLICPKLIENSIQIFLSCWLLSGRGRRLSLCFALF